MTAIHVVGIGLSGWADLTEATRQIVAQATLLVGSDRHLSYFADHPAPRLTLVDLVQGLADLKTHLEQGDPQTVVVLTSGDPLFFGLGRLLLMRFPPDQLFFHPHLSSVQLAFSRVKVPWQDAEVISAHGRSLEQLIQALAGGIGKIAILTDAKHTPAAIAHLFLDLDLSSDYQFWVCENLGGVGERVQNMRPECLVRQTFAPLTVVILLRQDRTLNKPLDLKALPVLGLADHNLLGFSDRPGLMTKREVRVLALSELQLRPQQVIWDIGAGTGSVSIEMARLVADAEIYAIEKTAMGVQLIQQNCERFQVETINIIQGTAPAALTNLPPPSRIFIGGSGGQLVDILQCCQSKLVRDGLMVMAIATLEHQQVALKWLQQSNWSTKVLHVQLARSIPIASLTRLLPLNPVMLIRAQKRQFQTQMN